MSRHAYLDSYGRTWFFSDRPCEACGQPMEFCPAEPDVGVMSAGWGCDNDECPNYLQGPSAREVTDERDPCDAEG